MHLWLSIRDGKPEAAMVTRFNEFPRMKVCFIQFIGGHDRKRWLRFQPQIEAWAKANGCSEMETYGRKGWIRVLKDYVVGWTILRKAL